MNAVRKKETGRAIKVEINYNSAWHNQIKA